MERDDDRARLQNTIAMEIANVHPLNSGLAEEKILDGSWSNEAVDALAAAVRHPVIWGAVANARQAVELAQRPIVTRTLQPLGMRSPGWEYDSAGYPHKVNEPARDKGDELARRARLTPGVRR